MLTRGNTILGALASFGMEPHAAPGKMSELLKEVKKVTLTSISMVRGSRAPTGSMMLGMDM